MPIPRRLAAAALLVAGLGGGEARALPREPDTWIRVETADFTLFSNASEKTTLEIGARLETFRGVLARLHPGLKVNSPLPTYIYVFKDDASFSPYKKIYGRASVTMDGYFVGHRDGNYVALNAAPQGDPYGPVYHEYVHYFMNNNFPHIPLWFNEGIAECYRTFLIENHRAAIGRPPEGYVDWLRANRLMPIADFLAIDTDSKEYNEEKRQGVYYTEAWALVHFLLWGEREWRSRLPERLARLDEGTSLAGLVGPAGYADLERDLAAYVKRGKFLYDLFELDALKVDATARVVPMAREEVLYRLGDFLIHSDPGRAAGAEEHFREAIRLNPAHGPSYAGLGFVRDVAGRHEEAAALYEKALRLDPDNDLTCFLYATSLVDRYYPKGISRRSPDEGSAPALARARELFAKSLRLRPNLAEAYAGLGATYAFEAGDLKEGIAALETARSALPGRKDVVFNLVSLYARHGDRAKARDLVDTVLSRWGDAAILREARESLLQGDLVAAQAALDKRDFDEGLRLLRGVLAATTDADLKGSLEPRIREVQETQEKNRQIALYNQAIDRANGRDLKGAIALLEQVVRETTQPDLLERARKTLADLKRASSRPDGP